MSGSSLTDRQHRLEFDMEAQLHKEQQLISDQQQIEAQIRAAQAHAQAAGAEAFEAFHAAMAIVPAGPVAQQQQAAPSPLNALVQGISSLHVDPGPADTAGTQATLNHRPLQHEASAGPRIK